MSSNDLKEIFSGFSKLSNPEQLKRLAKSEFLTEDDLLLLQQASPLSRDSATHFIENLIGLFQIPLGVALHFVIDGKDYIIPMAIEETSVIAAASKTAKWIRDYGELTTENLGWHGIGQIQIPKVCNLTRLKETLQQHKKALQDEINTKVIPGMVTRGGGLDDIQLRVMQRRDGSTMAVIHVLINTCDAMGANTINQVCEYLKPKIAKLTDERMGLCILSSLVDAKVTRATAVIHDIDPLVGEAIEEASIFAELDPYRAATSNKGIMNAIDALLIATGNDWRAVEAGVHAYASRSGQYQPLTRWWMQDNALYGIFEAPIDVGIVGGVTRLHPLVQTCLNMLRIKNASELARIAAAVGLVQNLAAIKALATEGIVRGHMKLHITNLLLAEGVPAGSLPELELQLLERLNQHQRISSADVKALLSQMVK